MNATRHYVPKSDQYGHCDPACPVDQPSIVVRAVDGSSGNLLDVQSKCARGSRCVQHIKCPSYLAERSQLTSLGRDSEAFRQKLQNLKASVCNFPENGVCCPESDLKATVSQLKATTGKLVEGSNGCSLPSQQCVNLDSCPALKFLAATKTREAIETVKSRICNKEKKLVCCDPEVSCSSGAEDLTHPAYLPRPESKECGTTDVTSRIIGGKTTKPGTYPSAVLLGRMDLVEGIDPFNPLRTIKTPKLKYSCGGTLINRWYVLTAAHCEDKRKPITKVALGEWDTGKDPDCSFTDRSSCLPAVQIIDVAEGDMIVHPDYRVGKNVFNDIALVKLSRPAKLNEGVQVACLPLDPAATAQAMGVANLRDGMVGKWPQVVGWGYTSGDPYTQVDKSNFANGGSSAELQQQVLAIPVLSAQDCRAKEWSSRIFYVRIDFSSGHIHKPFICYCNCFLLVTWA